MVNLNKMPDKEDNNTGFSGIGKRVEELKDTGSIDDTTAWKVGSETPDQATVDSASEQGEPKNYKQKRRFPFRLTAAKVFCGVVALVIIVAMFSGNNKKPSEPTSAPGRWVDVSTEEEFQTLMAEREKQSNDGKYVTVGQYRCSKYHHSTAQKLLPGAYEEQSIESESSALASLKNEIETDYVDRYSQDSIDRHNMLVDDYNSRIQSHKMSIDNYNKEVATYNNYLLNNCSKAY